MSTVNEIKQVVAKKTATSLIVLFHEYTEFILVESYQLKETLESVTGTNQY